MDTRPIGVFDSGVGGLSVLRELHKLLPKEDFVFLADQAYVPYGEKTADQLCDRSSKITEFLLAKNIKLLVVACNTATCYAIDYLREKFELPIVGTVPAIKLAAEYSKKCIGIISTPATSKSTSLHGLIQAYAKEIKVINTGCPGLENAVEEGDLKSTKVKNLLLKYLWPVTASGADAIVLGCTHYPFLKDTIKNIVGPKMKIIDSGPAIARRVKHLLEVSGSLTANGGRTIYFTTGDNKSFSGVASQLLKAAISSDHIAI